MWGGIPVSDRWAILFWYYPHVIWRVMVAVHGMNVSCVRSASPYTSIMKGMGGLPLIAYNHRGIITCGTFYIYGGSVLRVGIITAGGSL